MTQVTTRRYLAIEQRRSRSALSASWMRDGGYVHSLYVLVTYPV
jgi:hypothetical protein